MKLFKKLLNIKKSILSENFIGQYEGIVEVLKLLSFKFNEKDCMLQVIMYSYYLIIRIEWFKKPLDWWPPAHVAQILGYAGLNLVISLTPLTFFNKKLSCSL